MATKTKREVVPTTLEQLQKMGFAEAPSEIINKRAVISVGATDKQGKSDLGLSGKPVVLTFDIDVGLEGVAERHKAAGKDIYIYRLRFSKTGGSQEEWAKQWDCDDEKTPGLKQVLIAAWGLPEGTVSLDTWSEAYELCRLARLGKLEQIPPLKYVEVNKEMRELVRLAYESTMSTVFIHKMKPEWKGGQKTDNFELVGWSDMEYNTQINLRPYTVLEEFKDKEKDPVTHFWVKVKNCRPNAKMAGKRYYCGKAGDPPGNMLQQLIDDMYKMPKKLDLGDDEDEKPKKNKAAKLQLED